MGEVGRVGRLGVVDDLEQADWLSARLHEWPLDVTAIVPTGFQAYCRIFHPAIVSSSPTGRRQLTWHEVARSTGHTAHPLMQWHLIAPAAYTFQDPSIGQLDRKVAIELGGLLAAHTGTPDSCWFAVWAGRQPLLIRESAPRFELSDREMYLLHGTVVDLDQNLAPEPLVSMPILAWPADRAWVLATNIDMMTTYLAADRSCVDAVLAAPGVEALRVTEASPVTSDSDRLNLT